MTFICFSRWSNVFISLILFCFHFNFFTVNAAHFHISNVLIRQGGSHAPVSEAPFAFKDVISRIKIDRKWFEKDNLLKIGSSIGEMSMRSPIAVKETVVSSMKAFFQSFLTIIPIGLIYNIRQIRSVKLWMKSGLTTGAEWAKISAIYVGGETFCRAIRGVDDRQNSYIGSGLASALLRIQEGPVGMLQGFAIGYVFMIAVDSIMKHSESSMALPVIEHHGDHGTSLARILFNHKGAVRPGPVSKLSPARLPPRASQAVTGTIRKIKR